MGLYVLVVVMVVVVVVVVVDKAEAVNCMSLFQRVASVRLDYVSALIVIDGGQV